jgi:hypothetical protein
MELGWEGDTSCFFLMAFTFPLLNHFCFSTGALNSLYTKLWTDPMYYRFIRVNWGVTWIAEYTKRVLTVSTSFLLQISRACAPVINAGYQCLHSDTAALPRLNQPSLLWACYRSALIHFVCCEKQGLNPPPPHNGSTHSNTDITTLLSHACSIERINRAGVIGVAGMRSHQNSLFSIGTTGTCSEPDTASLIMGCTVTRARS